MALDDLATWSRSNPIASVSIAALVVVVIVMVYRAYAPDSKGFASDAERARLQAELDAMRGVGGDLRIGRNTPSVTPAPGDYGVNGKMTPEQRAEAERRAWSEAQPEGAGGFSPADDASAVRGGRDLNYNDYLTGQVVDDRMAKNHAEWAKGAFTSRVPRMVDDIQDEDYVAFTGFRRPQATIVSDDAWQISQVGPEHLARNADFRWTTGR